MPITYIKRDTASDITSPLLDTLVDEFYKAMNTTTGTSVEITISIVKAATECLKWISESGSPNKLDWDGGSYTWELRVITANTNLSIIEVVLRRLSSDGATVRASQSSGAISVSLGTTGVKSGNISWTTGQNPSGRQQSDRLEVVFKIQNAAAHATSSAGVGSNTVDDELITPLVPPAVIVERDVTETLGAITDATQRATRRYAGVSEPSISVSDSPLTATVKRLGVDEPPLTVSDSVVYTLRRDVPVTEPAISAADAVSLALRRTVEVSEPPVSVSDAVTAGLFKSVEASEPPISFGDSASYLLQRTKSVDELGIGVSDLAGYTLRRAISVEEPPLTVSDSTEEAVTRTKSVLETSIPTSDDAVGEVVTPMQTRSVSEPAVPVSDGVALTLQRAIDVSEPSIPFSDSAEKTVTKSVPVSEPAVDVSDSAEYLLRRFRDVSEPGIPASDSAYAVKYGTPVIVERSPSEGLGAVTDTPSTSKVGQETLLEQVGLVGDHVKPEVNPPEVLVPRLMDRILKLEEELKDMEDEEIKSVAQHLEKDRASRR